MQANGVKHKLYVVMYATPTFEELLFILLQDQLDNSDNLSDHTLNI